MMLYVLCMCLLLLLCSVWFCVINIVLWCYHVCMCLVSVYMHKSCIVVVGVTVCVCINYVGVVSVLSVSYYVRR